MNAKKIIILVVFTILFIFSVISRIYLNDFQDGWVAYEKKDYKTARELWLPLVEQGDPRATFYLGFMHDMGFGVPENDKEAIKWYKLAAERGDSRGLLFLGYIYDFGSGVPEDNEKAFKWYWLAAKQGFNQAKIKIYDLAKNNVSEAFKILVNDAENGSAEAQYILGAMYDSGQGVPQNNKEAVNWYSFAKEQGYTIAKVAIYGLANKGSPEALKILVNDAENGSAEAQYILGAMYDRGQGVPQNNKEAVKWYSLAKEQGNATATAAIYVLAKKNSSDALKILINDGENGNAIAQSTLSMMYQFGLGVPQDNHKAIKWHRFVAERELDHIKTGMLNFDNKNIPQTLKALSNDAENGSEEAQLNLAMMWQLGLVVPEDEAKAAYWFRLATEQGDSKAQSIMGLIYAKGQGVPQDDRASMKWYRLAAKASIASERAKIYELAKQNVPQALKIMTDDAENGIVEAQKNLGLMLRFGLGVPKNEKKAAEWYRLAAEQGNVTAQSIMGSMYTKGQGVPQDDREAMKWYRLAEENRVPAEKLQIYELAKQNVPQALKILTDDAESGVVEAQYNLGKVHADGFGLLYDIVLAHMWYNLAALQGYEVAIDEIKFIEKQMSPHQIEQAQERVRDWKPKK